VAASEIGKAQLDRLTVVHEGEGTPLSDAGSNRLIARAEWMAGAVCILDQVQPPGRVSPVHMHANETQAAYLISGRLGFWVGGEESEVGPGGYVVRPAGKPHALWNPTDQPARMLEITSPADGFQRFMLELAALRERGEADAETVKRVAAGYGVTFFDDLTEELCRRHGVDPRGSFWR
jgi:mannose-6-phosphate isomerase-like protein (cupin superfamily)